MGHEVGWHNGKDQGRRTAHLPQQEPGLRHWWVSVPEDIQQQSPEPSTSYPIPEAHGVKKSARSVGRTVRHLSKYALVLLWACVPSVKGSRLGVEAFRQEQGASVGVGKGGSQARARGWVRTEVREIKAGEWMAALSLRSGPVRTGESEPRGQKERSSGEC